MKYQINQECIGCQACVPECAVEAITFSDPRCEINLETCVGCAKCVEVCPVGAIISVE